MTRLYYRIHAPVATPIRGGAGDVLAVWLGHVPWNCAVLDACHVRRTAVVPEDRFQSSSGVASFASSAIDEFAYQE